MGESRTVEFKEGVALITVKDLLGGLDVNGDGVSMEKLGSVLGYSALNIIGELADKDGKTSEVKLVIKLSEK
ncbi:hypothetical protein N6H14_06025 [Paenibacillus sp. CC-CFT747]|nr:hypothetical protein N6H14_06025 [Paenibacillus sp. CC-CFT747]